MGPAVSKGTTLNQIRLPPVVVVGLDCITGLQAARTLARHGVPVIGIASDVRHYCCRTRVCERIVEAETTSGELIPALEALASTLDQKAVLLPCTDLSVLAISRGRANNAECEK